MSDEHKTEDVIKEFGERELGSVKVLMVEDDTFLMDLVLSKLSKSGCVPYSATNGQEVIDLAEQFQPDIIILDLMLPDVQGEEVLAQLKSHETLKDIPVIVFSNKSDESDVQNSLKLGAEEHFVKSSTDFSQLTDVVKRLAKPKH